MLRRKLAENLVSSKSESQRRILLAENKTITDEKLAWQIKEVCYESWANEPTKAQNAADALTTLKRFRSGEEINAVFHWVVGISELTKGNLEKSIKNLNESAEIFRLLKKEKESADTKVAKLIPLALLGKYDEAIDTGEQVLESFEEFDDQLAAGKVEMNLSNIVSRRGQHEKAKKYCHSALNRFVKTNEKTWQTMAENGLANTYSELNDFRKAEKFYERALKSARSAKMFVTEAEIEASLGNLATFRGRFSDALNFLEISRRKFEKLDMPHQTVIAELEIAEIYQTLNLNTEAFELYERISDSLKRLKLRSEEARSRHNFGKVSIKKGDVQLAGSELRKAAKLFLAEKNVSGAASVKLSEASLELSLGKFKDALQIIHEAKKLLKESENLRYKLQANFLHGEILRNLRKFRFADRFLNETYDQAVKNEQMTLAQNCLNSLGKLALQKDDETRAERYFKKSIDLFENLRSPLPSEEFRMAFMANSLFPFESLARIYLKRNKLEKAFAFIEKAKARTLGEAIQNNQPKTESIDKTLVEKLDSLREELNWYYSRLNQVEESEIEPIQNSVQTLEKKIATLTRQINSTLKTVVSDQKSNENLLESLKGSLRQNQALIEYVQFEGTFSAFIVTKKGIEFYADIATESEVLSLLESLRFQFGTLRYGKDLANKFAIDLKKKSEFYLLKLYEKLIAPLEEFVKERNLVIVPVSTLFYVPFQALFDGKKYTIETREITTSPSAGVWQSLTRKPRKLKLGKTFLMGFADEKIPLVHQEIESLKKIFTKAKSYTGKHANFTNYNNNAVSKDIIHLACHGQFRPDNPLFSNLQLADGFITVRDICSQNLDAELVTLSACETGLNEVHAGDEILGLARGFLSAGCRTLILSLWTVNDEATQNLMENFYTNLQRGNSISASLQIAQKKFIEAGKHPYFWASFGIIGK